MLDLAVKATLPIVNIATRDVMNLPEVVEAITGVNPKSWKPSEPIQKGQLYMYVNVPSVTLPLVSLYEKLVTAESTLLIVNAQFAEPGFDAGEVSVPREMLHKLMISVTEDEKVATELMRGLGGCTIKEAAELARLTMARDNSLTCDGLLLTRKSSFQGMKGLTQVDSSQSFYEAPDYLQSFVKEEKQFFLTGDDYRLIPRGLLMDGPPGTGKTAAAKWLAAQWGIPLYRVDIGGTKNKYVGESEANMLTNLSRLDHEEPCVALIDEVEKVFAASHNDTSGTTTTMMSQLLWWLAERRSRVFVVMTTNNAKALPMELYREGRIDRVMWFNGLEEGKAVTFVKQVLATFKGIDFTTVDAAKIKDSATKIPSTNPVMYSQASLTTAVYNFVKAKKAVAGNT